MKNFTRQLLEAGEAPGDIGAFKPLGWAMRLFDSGGSSQSSQPTTQTINQNTIPEYAAPYAQAMLGQTAALTDINQNPYQPYAGQQVANFNPLQVQAFNQIGNQRTAAQNDVASGMAYGVGQQAMQYGGYQPGQFNSGYNPVGIGSLMTGTGQFTDPNVVASYMNPYFRNVVDYQTQEAIRDYNKTLPAEQALAASKGAFGGNRQALNQSEMQRNLNTQLGGIAATGASNAFNAAQQAFMADQARNLASQQGNQQAYLTAQGQRLTNAQNAAQYGLQAQQLGEQSRQFGAGLGLQGLQTGLQAANQLGQLGNQDFTQQQAINQAQLAAGAQQQANTQRQLDVDFQKYANQLNYPYQQLAFMQGAIQGLPLSQTATSMYQAPPSTGASLASLGLGAYGLSGLLGKKEGGVVKMAGGGIADQYRLLSTANNMPDGPLMKSAAVPSYVKQAIMQQRGMLRTAMPPKEEQGVAALPAQNMEFADGGIVGFDRGGFTGKEGLLRPDEAPYDPLAWIRGLPTPPMSAILGARDVSLPDAYGPQSYSIADLQKRVASKKLFTPSAEEYAEVYGRQSTPSSPAVPDLRPAGIAATGAAQAAAPSMPPAQAPAFQPAPADTFESLLAQHRTATDAMRADNPLYDKHKALEKESDSMKEGIAAFKEKTPYLMALHAAAELGKAGQGGGTISSIARALGVSGEEYSKREKQAEEMGIKALDQRTKMLAIEDALHKGDAAVAKDLIDRTQMSKMKRDELNARVWETQQKVATDATGHRLQYEVGMDRNRAMREATAARAAMVNTALKDNILAQTMLKNTEAQVLNELKADQKANPVKYMDKDISALARAEALRRLHADPNFLVVAKRAGIATLADSQDAGWATEEGPVRPR